MIPAFQDSNVQSGFCTNLLQELVSHHDTKQSHINFVVLEMRIVSYSQPFDASSIQLMVLLKKNVRDVPLLKRMLELGMTLKGEDVIVAVEILPDDRTEILQLILSNFKFEPAFFKAVQKTALDNNKRQFLSCLKEHIPQPPHGSDTKVMHF